jgi:Papain-like cysteine protease AvrRpt2
MPLSINDLTAVGETPITIQSTYFSNVFLRMDGTGVTGTTAGGTVNCQYGSSEKERYKIRAQSDGTYCFESAAFPNVYLRMDGAGVTTTGPGGGTVNCQVGVGPYTKYRMRAQTNGSFSFESNAFPNVFLRLVGSGVTATTNTGGGTVNCQFNANGGGHESFFLNMADQRLNFVMEHQEQTLWCWDAASVSVAKFYNPNSAWTQCSLANAELGRNDCCVPSGQVSPCNQGRWPDTVLQRVGHLRERQNNALGSVQLAAELANSAPVVVNIAWAGGGGHIAALRGRSLRDGAEWVSVADPWYGDSDVAYDAFLNRYQNSGTWTVSYRTQR